MLVKKDEMSAIVPPLVDFMATQMLVPCGVQVLGQQVPGGASHCMMGPPVWPGQSLEYVPWMRMPWGAVGGRSQ